MREPALRVLRAWLADPATPRLCVVTGSPGTGKSRLLAEFLTAQDTSFDAVLSARGMTADVIEWSIAGELALPSDGLLARLSGDQRPTTIAIGEFDEAGPALDGADCGEIVTTLLRPLAALPHVRLLIEGRPGAVDGFGTEATVLNLDDPRVTDRTAFTAELPDLAFPNISAGLLGGATARQWLDAQPEETLPALYALGLALAPLDLATWRALCTVLAGDEARARSSIEAAAPVVARADGSFALMSRTLRDTARRKAGARPGITEALTGTVPRRADGRPDWREASAYVLRHLPYHGVTSVLADTEFLLTADPVAITAAFENGGPAPLRRAWRLAAPALVMGAAPAERAALLRLAALWNRDEETARLFAAEQTEWEVVAAEPGPPASGSEGRLRTAGADGRVHVAKGRLVTGPHDVAAITVADDEAALVLDPSRGLQVAEPAGDHPLGTGASTDRAPLIAAVERRGAELTAVGAGDGVLLTGDRAGNVHAWPTATAPSSVHLHEGPVTAVACVRTDVCVIVSGGADGAVRTWTLGEESSGLLAQRRSPVGSAAAGTLSTGPAFVTAWADGMVAVWDMKSGEGASLRLGHLVRSVAFTDEDTIVVAGRPGTATIRLRPALAWPG